MRKIFFTLLLITAALVFAKAQNTLKKGSWGVDHEKGIIVINDMSMKSATTLSLDQTYILEKPLKKGEAVTAHDADGNEYRAYLSTLPIITITTDGEIVNTPAVHGMMTVSDGDSSLTVHAGLKIRGTSSQQYDKKSYRVELWRDAEGLSAADTVLLGLRNDDDWNLEAMTNQPLRLRNKIANELWQEIFTVSYIDSVPNARAGIRMKYVDVYLNNSYVGVYTLTERIDRKQLGVKKYSTKIRGLLVKGNGEGAPSFETLPAYTNTSDTWDNFEWVYPNEADSLIDWSHIFSIVNFVKNASNNVFNSQYASVFDRDNLLDYYLFINTLGAADNMARNIFLARYNRTGTFFYVPWDLDAILGLDTDGNVVNTTTGLKTNGLFTRLLSFCSTGSFTELMQERYNELRTTYLSKEHIMEMINEQYNYLNDNGAYAREAEAWSDFTLNPNELDRISTWLNNRFNYLDNELFLDCGTIGIDETTDNIIRVYPNPANDIINIEKDNSDFVTIRLFDMTGRVVLETSGNGMTIQISSSSLPEGIYNIVMNANGWQKTGKIAINR